MDNRKKENYRKTVNDMLEEYKENMLSEIDTSGVPDKVRDLIEANTRQTFYLVEHLAQLVLDSVD